MSRVRWLAPSPLWDDLLGNAAAFRAPALLRFASDDFIPQFQSVLEQRPRDLRGFVARPETWREPGAGLDLVRTGDLRLYQPVHGRFYMVTATLACRVPGLPEHTVDVAAGEVVAFVVRRIAEITDENGAVVDQVEQAWVKRADGSHGWTEATSPFTLVPDEEQHPMFGAAFKGAGDLERRVFGGLIPASRRESYVGGRELAPAAVVATPVVPGSIDDPRVLDFQGRFLEPLVELEAWFRDEKAEGSPRHARALDAAEQATAPMLLDLHDFLRDELENVWRVMTSAPNAPTLPQGQQALLNELETLGLYTRTAGNRATLPEAAVNAAAHRSELEALLAPVVWPTGYVPRLLVGDPRATPVTSTPTPDPADDDTHLQYLLARVTSPEEVPGLGVRRLKALVMAALAEEGEAPIIDPAQLPARAPLNAQGDDWFVVRCAYLRPNCGKLSPPLVSDASARFKLASFFEPEAPARHLRVALPVDTSPATLRKYNRNVSFMLSDQLRQQMNRIKDMEKLIDGDVDAPAALNIGMICSFSIPIITICALILLMILVSLLNIIFWWLPFFRICFPLPTLKAKG